MELEENRAETLILLEQWLKIWEREEKVFHVELKHIKENT